MLIKWFSLILDTELKKSHKVYKENLIHLSKLEKLESPFVNITFIHFFFFLSTPELNTVNSEFCNSEFNSE